MTEATCPRSTLATSVLQGTGDESSGLHHAEACYTIDRKRTSHKLKLFSKKVNLIRQSLQSKTRNERSLSETSNKFNSAGTQVNYLSDQFLVLVGFAFFGH